MHRLYVQVQGDFSILTEAVRERFSGIRLIKAHHGEAAEAEQVADISKRYVASNISLAKIIGAFFPMMLFFSNLSMAAVLYLGGRQTITAAITPGDFVAFISYLGILTWPMMALGWVSNLIQRGKASLDRLARIFETGSRIVDGPHAAPITNRPPRLELRGVSFSHNTPPDAVSPILSDLHLDLAPGYMMGIVGPPGGGKTALLNLIARLYDVTDGGIYLDGEDIRNLTLESVRRRIAVVPQEPFLFAGTIRDNIQLETDGNRETDMIEAARQACLHETVRAFPRGYDTVVGEKGVILSGGQKQRVALARAFFRNAPLLLLDDPISQVDTHTGQAIVRTLREQAGDKTVVIASHRLSALTFADHIITLKNGHIQEAGTHARLMSADGYYAETYRMQEIQEALLD